MLKILTPLSLGDHFQSRTLNYFRLWEFTEILRINIRIRNIIFFLWINMIQQNVCFLLSSYPLHRVKESSCVQREPCPWLGHTLWELFIAVGMGMGCNIPIFFCHPLCDKMKQLPRVKFIYLKVMNRRYVYIPVLWSRTWIKHSETGALPHSLLFQPRTLLMFGLGKLFFVCSFL